MEAGAQPGQRPAERRPAGVVHGARGMRKRPRRVARQPAQGSRERRGGRRPCPAGVGVRPRRARRRTGMTRVGGGRFRFVDDARFAGRPGCPRRPRSAPGLPAAAPDRRRLHWPGAVAAVLCRHCPPTGGLPPPAIAASPADAATGARQAPAIIAKASRIATRLRPLGSGCSGRILVARFVMDAALSLAPFRLWRHSRAAVALPGGGPAPKCPLLPGGAAEKGGPEAFLKAPLGRRMRIRGLKAICGSHALRDFSIPRAPSQKLERRILTQLTHCDQNSTRPPERCARREPSHSL